MLQQVFIVFAQVLTLFLMIGVGFYLGRARKIKEGSQPDITYIMIHVALPCAIIKSMTALDATPEFLRSIGYATLIIVVITTISAAVSLFMFRGHAQEQRSVLQMGTVYSNSAFMGIALVQAVLGDSAIIYATLIMIVETVYMLIHCEITMSQGGRPNLKKAVVNPGVIGFLIGLILMLGRISLPGPIASTINAMGSMNTPLAMILVGLQIAKVDLRSVFNQKNLYIIAAVKLVVLPLILLVGLRPLGLSTVAFCAIVICKGTTQPAVLSVYAADHKQDGVLGAQIVALTTVLQIVTLPLIAALTQVFAP